MGEADFARLDIDKIFTRYGKNKITYNHAKAEIREIYDSIRISSASERDKEKVNNLVTKSLAQLKPRHTKVQAMKEMFVIDPQKYINESAAISAIKEKQIERFCDEINQNGTMVLLSDPEEYIDREQSKTSWYMYAVTRSTTDDNAWRATTFIATEGKKKTCEAFGFIEDKNLENIVRILVNSRDALLDITKNFDKIILKGKKYVREEREQQLNMLYSKNMRGK